MNTLKIKQIIGCISLAMVFISGIGCSTMNKSQKGAVIGVGAGGALGALVGKLAGNTAVGALVGGAVGGTTGAIIGHHMDKQAEELKNTLPNANVTRAGEGIIVKFDSGILFDIDQTYVKSAAQTDLRNFAVSLQNNPQTNILIVGHTDNAGTAAHNMDLSIRRAEAVRSILVGYNVDGSRLNTQGKGENEPIADNTTVTGRAGNRRVEIVISANDQMKNQATNGQ